MRAGAIGFTPEFFWIESLEEGESVTDWPHGVSVYHLIIAPAFFQNVVQGLVHAVEITQKIVYSPERFFRIIRKQQVLLHTADCSQ